MYIRVCCTVEDKGTLVPLGEEFAHIQKQIDKKPNKALKDWYTTPYVYPEEILEYVKNNKNSTSGYNGEAFPRMLYWDIDCEEDLSKSRKNTVKLANYIIRKLELPKEELKQALRIYFSGKKGFHVTLEINTKIDKDLLIKLCKGISHDAELEEGVLDTKVYNLTRIFRTPNTHHNNSNYYKIPITYKQLVTCTLEEIKSLAETTQPFIDPEPIDISSLVEKYKDWTLKPDIIVEQTEEETINSLLQEFNVNKDGNTQRRRCIVNLENGEFGANVRHDCCLRMAAYHKHEGKTQSDSKAIILKALELRAGKYDVKPFKIEEIETMLDSVYHDNWNGGIFSCKTDELLQKACSGKVGICASPRKEEVKNLMQIDQLFAKYVEYGEEASADYPEFGLSTIDSKLRIRPKNYSILAGANGAGKTSILLHLMDRLNEKKMHHLFFSLDMADTSLFEKLAAKYTMYSISEIEMAFNKFSRDTKIMGEVLRVLREKLPYTHFDFTSTTTMEYIKNQIKKTNDLIGEPLKMVFVDYTGRIIANKDSDYAKATYNANMANDVVKETGTHIMFVSQIAREHGDHTTPLIKNRVAKETGSWEENATFVMTLWRPFGDGVDGLDNYMATYVGKNRTGSNGEQHFGWDGKTGDIIELEEEEVETYKKLCEEHGKRAPSGFNYQAKSYGTLPEERTTELSENNIKNNRRDEFRKDDDEQETTKNSNRRGKRPRSSRISS